MIKLAEALDEATGNAIEVYQLLQEDGTYVNIEVGREIACDEAAFRKELNKSGRCCRETAMARNRSSPLQQ